MEKEASVLDLGSVSQPQVTEDMDKKMSALLADVVANRPENVTRRTVIIVDETRTVGDDGSVMVGYGAGMAGHGYSGLERIGLAEIVRQAITEQG